MDRREILMYRAMLYEIGGEPSKAVATLRNLLPLYSWRRPDLEERIVDLQNGRTPRISAEAVWKELLERKSHHICDRDDTEGHAGHDHDREPDHGDEDDHDHGDNHGHEHNGH